MAGSGSKCTAERRKPSQEKSVGQTNKTPRLSQLETEATVEQKPRNVTRPEAVKQRTYPENDVEPENEILDAAAHFVSLEMLS